MAILLDFEMVREDPEEIEYSFGNPEKDRRLVIDKVEARGHVSRRASLYDSRVYGLWLSAPGAAVLSIF